jgi:hypothetical protein
MTLEQGGRGLYLFTGQQNLGAQAFYERNGYELLGPTYRKPLAPPLPRQGEGDGG